VCGRWTGAQDQSVLETEKSGGVMRSVPNRQGVGVDPGKWYNSSLDVDSAGRVAEGGGKGGEERGNGCIRMITEANTASMDW
jgi:hypothetical protein